MYLDKQPQSLAVPISGLKEAIQQRTAQQEAAAQPAWEKNLKRGLAVVVATCGVLVTTLPEHTVIYKVCVAVVGIGAALGITSSGNTKQ